MKEWSTDDEILFGIVTDVPNEVLLLASGVLKPFPRSLIERERFESLLRTI